MVAIKKKIFVIKEIKDTLEDNYLSGKIDSVVFNDLNNKLNLKLRTAEMELENAKSDEFPYEKMINEGVNIISDIGEYYRTANGKQNREFLVICFQKNWK